MLENTHGSVICKLPSMLSWPPCFKWATVSWDARLAGYLKHQMIMRWPRSQNTTMSCVCMLIWRLSHLGKLWNKIDGVISLCWNVLTYVWFLSCESGHSCDSVTLKTEGCYFVITGGPEGCHYDNLGCYHWLLLLLTHWGRDKMAEISQTTFSNAFSWMKIYEFRFKVSLKFVP